MRPLWRGLSGWIQIWLPTDGQIGGQRLATPGGPKCLRDPDAVLRCISTIPPGGALALGGPSASNIRASRVSLRTRRR